MGGLGSAVSQDFSNIHLIAFYFYKTSKVASHISKSKTLQNKHMFRNVMCPRKEFGIQVYLFWSLLSTIKLCFISLHSIVFAVKKLKRS